MSGPGRRRAIAAGVVAVVGVLMCAPVPAVAGDAGVMRAQGELERARATVTQTSTALDQAVELYERAAAHHERLLHELRRAEAGVRRAVAGEAGARAALRRRVATAYRTPHADLALAEAVLYAPDPATALHVASLVSRLTVRSAREVGEHRTAERHAARALRQRRIIAAGTAGAAEAQRVQAQQLTAALEAARRDVGRAEQAVSRAHAEARARAAAARITAVPSALLLDGKACPVAGPNGFIDSWGFPRSEGRTHKGVDIFAASGTPLVAVADGLVRRVYTNRLGGLSIDFVDTHGDRYYYAHLASATAATGQAVRAGEVIGTVGQSGNARGTPPHLHWQYHPGGGEPVNPYPLARALCR